jgi:hypothetical protein
MQSFISALFSHDLKSIGQHGGRDKERSANESGPEEAIMSGILWMNVPLMVLFIALWAGIPLWLVARRHDWHHKPEARAVPAYLAARRTPRTLGGLIRVPQSARYDGRLTMRPLRGGANG